jgi:hypothetical protein
VFIMKSQESGISFILAVVIAMLVLGITSILFFSTFKIHAVSRQKAINDCNTYCLQDVEWAASGGEFPKESKYCEWQADVEGMGKNLHCNDITTCHVEQLGCDITCKETGGKMMAYCE